MNTIQKGISTLLCCAITGKALPLPEDFRLEDAMPLIRSHGITTLVYEGAVRCGVDQSLPVMRELFQIYYQMMLQSERQVQEIKRLFAAFDARGIAYLPLKGCKMKELYPRPELRLMGDADVLIRVNQYQEKIEPLLVELGFTYVRSSTHEINWSNKGLYLELHKRLIPTVYKNYCAYFGDGWRLAVPESGSRYTMTPEDEFLFLFTHFTKHYRNGGIGCRHVVDLWVYLHCHPELDMQRLEAELSQLGLLEFYGNVRRLMDAWFADGAEDERTAFMTEFIFASGSWGTLENWAITGALRRVKRTPGTAAGKISYILPRLFPGINMLRQKYTILQKAPWMLPLVWLYRPFYKIFCERKDLRRHERHLKMINKESLEYQIQMLHFVGLDENNE